MKWLCMIPLVLGYQYHAPNIQIERQFVVNAAVEDLQYNHDSSIIKFDGEWLVSWNGNQIAKEGKPGQLNYLSVSDHDPSTGGPKGTWSPHKIAFPGVACPPVGCLQWQPNFLVFRKPGSDEEYLGASWSQDGSATAAKLGMYWSEYSKSEQRFQSRFVTFGGSPNPVFNGTRWKIFPSQDPIQVSRDTRFSGRIVAPVVLTNATGSGRAPDAPANVSGFFSIGHRCSVMLSDDAGTTWNFSEGTIQPGKSWAQWEPTVYEAWLQDPISSSRGSSSAGATMYPSRPTVGDNPSNRGHGASEVGGQWGLVMLCRNNDFRAPSDGGPMPWERLLWSTSIDGGGSWSDLQPVGIDTTVSRPHVLRPPQPGMHRSTRAVPVRDAIGDSPVHRIPMVHNDYAESHVSGRLSAAVFTMVAQDGPLPSAPSAALPRSPLDGTEHLKHSVMTGRRVAPLGFAPGITFTELGELAMYPQMAWGTVPTNAMNLQSSSSDSSARPRTLVVSYSSGASPRSIRVAVIQGLPLVGSQQQDDSAASNDTPLLAHPRENTPMNRAPALVEAKPPTPPVHALQFHGTQELGLRGAFDAESSHGVSIGAWISPLGYKPLATGTFLDTRNAAPGTTSGMVFAMTPKGCPTVYVHGAKDGLNVEVPEGSPLCANSSAYRNSSVHGRPPWQYVGVSLWPERGVAAFVRTGLTSMLALNVSFPPRAANLSAPTGVARVGGKAIPASTVPGLVGNVHALLAWRAPGDADQFVLHTGAANSFASSLGLPKVSPATASPPAPATRAMWLNASDPAGTKALYEFPPPAAVAVVSNATGPTAAAPIPQLPMAQVGTVCGNGSIGLEVPSWALRGPSGRVELTLPFNVSVFGGGTGTGLACSRATVATVGDGGAPVRIGVQVNGTSSLVFAMAGTQEHGSEVALGVCGGGMQGIVPGGGVLCEGVVSIMANRTHASVSFAPSGLSSGGANGRGHGSSSSHGMATVPMPLGTDDVWAFLGDGYPWSGSWNAGASCKLPFDHRSDRDDANGVLAPAAGGACQPLCSSTVLGDVSLALSLE